MIQVESFGIVPFLNEGGNWKVLLILHKEGNHWGFPKGKKTAESESALEAAVRELKEETSLEVDSVLSTEPLTERYQFRRKKELVIKIVQYFPALVKGNLQLQEEEVREAKWLGITEALDQLSFREARHILQECVRLLNLKPS